MAAAAAMTPSIRNYGRILVASADSSFRRRLITSPVYGRARSEEAVGGAHALAKLAQFSCDGVLLDRHLPDLDAAEVAELIRQKYPRTEVEFVDSQAEARPFEAAEGNGNNERPEEKASLAHDVAGPLLRSAAAVEELTESLPGMIGASRAMQNVYRLVRMVAPRDTTVLIAGETGTGKELVAQAVHQLSSRRKQPFIVVNCAAIPEALFEAELFGYSRGAFTGAVQSRLGRVHLAQGGTLFLDEVGELPLSMQAKLLRFLQNGEVQRLGSSDVYRVDVRVLCATNMRLQEQVQRKLFRQDLYYRLAIFPIGLPLLRERAEDIAALSEHFLEQLSAECEVEEKRLTAPALALLQELRWEGNVRELQHVIERAFILAGNETTIRAEHLQPIAEMAN